MNKDNQTPNERPDNETGKDETSPPDNRPILAGVDGAYYVKLAPDGSNIYEPIKADMPLTFGLDGVKAARLLGDIDIHELAADLGFEITSETTVMHGSAEVDVLRRMFEPEPPNARLTFRPLDIVRLARPELFGLIPVGAVGVVQHLEHPESAMAAKGRHYFVRFDLTPFKLPYPESTVKFYEANRRDGDPDMPPYMVEAAVNVGALDLGLVKRGLNWRPDYTHEYEADRYAAELLTMTPEQRREQMRRDMDSAIAELTREHRLRTPGTPAPYYPGLDEAAEPSPGKSADSLDILKRAASGERLNYSDFPNGVADEPPAAWMSKVITHHSQGAWVAKYGELSAINEVYLTAIDDLWKQYKADEAAGVQPSPGFNFDEAGDGSDYVTGEDVSEL